MAKNSPSAMLSVAEAGKLLDVSDRQVRNMISSGVLSASKVGRDYVIQRADVNAVPRDRKPGPKAKRKA